MSDKLIHPSFIGGYRFCEVVIQCLKLGAVVEVCDFLYYVSDGAVFSMDDLQIATLWLAFLALCNFWVTCFPNRRTIKSSSFNQGATSSRRCLTKLDPGPEITPGVVWIAAEIEPWILSSSVRKMI